MFLQFFSIVFLICFGYGLKFQFNPHSSSKKVEENYIKAAGDNFGTSMIEWPLKLTRSLEKRIPKV